MKIWLEEMNIIMLEVMSSSTAETSGRISVSSLNSLLESWGVDQSPKTLAFLESLFQAGFPLSKDLILTLNSVLPNFSPDDKTALILALNFSLPLTPSVIDELNSIINNLKDFELTWPKLLGISPKLFADSPETAGLYKLLQQLSSLVSIPQTTFSTNRPTSDFVRQLLSSSGIFMESSLAAGKPLLPPFDLKSLLLAIKNELSNLQIQQVSQAKSELINTVSSSVDKLLQNITMQQINNQPALSNPNIVIVPMWDGTGWQNLELLFNGEREPDGKWKPDSISVTLQVNMSKLGKIRTEIFQPPPSWKVKFYTESEETENIIRKNISALEERFKKVDLPLGSVMIQFVKELETLSSRLYPTGQNISTDSIDISV